VSVFWLFLSCIIIGTCKAAQDTIRHHFGQSIFNVKREWLNRWFKSDWQDWPLYFGMFRLDAWHFFGWIHYLAVGLLVGSAVHYAEFDWTVGLVILPIIFFMFFSLYKVGFIRKEFRP